MNKKLVKKAIEGLLQYGWMWGYPKHIKKEQWYALRTFYRVELNNGIDFIPDETNRAKI